MIGIDNETLRLYDSAIDAEFILISNSEQILHIASLISQFVRNYTPLKLGMHQERVSRINNK